MKLRTNALAAYQGEMADCDGKFSHRPTHTLIPTIMAGGPHEQHNAEVHRQTLLQVLNSSVESCWQPVAGIQSPLAYHDCTDMIPDIPAPEMRVSVVYRWRSERHLMRWLKQQQLRKRGKQRRKTKGWWREWP